MYDNSVPAPNFKQIKTGIKAAEKQPPVKNNYWQNFNHNALLSGINNKIQFGNFLDLKAYT